MVKLASPSRVARAMAMLAISVIGVSIQGCALFYEAPAVEILDVQVVALGLTSGTAEVALEVTNESGRVMEIRGFLYEIEVKGPGEGANWITLAEGFHDQELVIPGRGTEEVLIPVPFQYSALGDAVRSLLSSGEIPYRLKGEIWLGGPTLGMQMPFKHEGVLKP